MLNRRTFLWASSGAAGGMLLSLYIDIPARAQSPASSTYPPEAFIHLRPDGTIVIQVNRLEFGQGVQTALPMILADEMDADWSQIVGELAPAADVYKDPIYQLQMTGGSISVPHSFQQYRELGAKMRAMLVATAAERWGVVPAQCRTENSVVYGPATQSARYVDLASEAARRPVPSEVRLKTSTEFRLIGTPVRRLDSRAKCDGSLRFGMDVDPPGLRVALVARPPVYGGRVKGLSDREARAVAGVRDVFEVPTIRGGTGVAVVADTFWMAKKARDRLNIEWDLSGVERVDTSQMRTRYAELSRMTGNVAVNRGDATVLDRISAAERIVADFSFPYLAHTPMEPLNTTIQFDGDRAEAWVPSQFQTMDQIAIAEVLGLKPEQVVFHTEYAGGGFGRRTPLDSHVQREAAAIAKRMRGTPVKVVWTREDDVRGGYYRPMFVHHVEVGVGARGMPAAWRHVVVGQSHIIGTGPPWEGALVKNGVDELVVEGTADSRYAIPNFHVSAHQPAINVPVAQWRSVGMTHNAFVMETLIDELAVRANVDPIAYRLALLRSDAKKLRNSLVLLEEKTRVWRSRAPRDHAIGIACNEYHETGVACAVEVSVESGRPRIHRATVTADVGMAINPLTLEAQFQGGIVYGLSQLVARGAITFSDGRVDQRNFDDHTPPYMNDAPVAIDVHIVPSTDPPTACGECPVPVISPAVVNALFRVTGKRYRTLPLTTL